MNLDLPQIGGECQDFTRWWNSEGQFLQPIGDMQSEYGLDFAKKIAESVYQPFHKLIGEAQEERDQAKSELLDIPEHFAGAKELITAIEKIVEIAVSSKDESIKNLIKEYREDYED